jgi:phosphate transport system permease protein
MTTITATPARNALTANRLPRWTPMAALAGAVALASLIVLPSASGPDNEFPLAAAIVLGGVLHLIILTTLSAVVEGRRRATDRFMTALVTIAFLIAMVPLFSVAITTVSAGLSRFDAEFFSNSMRNVTGEGGGALHAIVGTVLMTLTAALISVPIGLLTAIYLVEYGRGALARGITFIVDVMTGIPSIVAGLFAYALFALILPAAG